MRFVGIQRWFGFVGRWRSLRKTRMPSDRWGLQWWAFSYLCEIQVIHQSRIKEPLSINDTHHKLNCILLYTALVARNLNRKFSTPYIDKTIVMCQISQPLIACSIYKLCFSEGRVLAPLGLGGRAEKALDTPIAFISWFQQEAPQNL